MRSDGNRLIFDRNLEGEPLPATAALHNLIEKYGYQDVTLDFTDSAKLYPQYMIPLVTICRSYRQRKIDFDVVLPADRKAAIHFINTNRSHLISPEKFEERKSKNTKHVSARQYFTADEHHKIVDESLAVILESIPGIDRNRLKALEWSLSEIMDNVLNHAQSVVGGVVQVVTRPAKSRVEFFVCDSGITIPRSLRRGRPDIQDDTSALRRAIEEGVTTNSTTNQGNGLFGTFKCCEVSGGEFDIISGNVCLRHRPGQIVVGPTKIPFTGTYVRASIGYDFEKLLERALVFGGRPHDPPYDFIERKYESDSDDIYFRMETELNAFGSREAGRSARNKIDNLMNNKTANILFDFSGVHLISSSFADEVFGKLFVDLGPLRFGQLCQFRNIDRTVRGLIDRAIAQRLRV